MAFSRWKNLEQPSRVYIASNVSKCFEQFQNHSSLHQLNPGAMRKKRYDTTRDQFIMLAMNEAVPCPDFGSRQNVLQHPPALSGTEECFCLGSLKVDWAWLRVLISGAVAKSPVIVPPIEGYESFMIGIMKIHSMSTFSILFTPVAATSWFVPTMWWWRLVTFHLLSLFVFFPHFPHPRNCQQTWGLYIWHHHWEVPFARHFLQGSLLVVHVLTVWWPLEKNQQVSQGMSWHVMLSFSIDLCDGVFTRQLPRRLHITIWQILQLIGCFVSQRRFDRRNMVMWDQIKDDSQKRLE